jgi:hypothetical protein
VKYMEYRQGPVIIGLALAGTAQASEQLPASVVGITFMLDRETEQTIGPVVMSNIAMPIVLLGERAEFLLRWSDEEFRHGSLRALGDCRGQPRQPSGLCGLHATTGADPDSCEIQSTCDERRDECRPGHS